MLCIWVKNFFFSGVGFAKADTNLICGLRCFVMLFFVSDDMALLLPLSDVGCGSCLMRREIMSFGGCDVQVV